MKIMCCTARFVFFINLKGSHLTMMMEEIEDLKSTLNSISRGKEKMKNKLSITFEELFTQNERKIHYHIQNFRIQDPCQRFYQEGLRAMWNAYNTYQPDKGTLSTYFNFTIRNCMRMQGDGSHASSGKKKKSLPFAFTN